MFRFPIIGTDLDSFAGIDSFQRERYQFFFCCFVGADEAFYICFNSDTFCLRLRTQSFSSSVGRLMLIRYRLRVFSSRHSIPDSSLLSRHGQRSFQQSNVTKLQRNSLRVEISFLRVRRNFRKPQPDFPRAPRNFRKLQSDFWKAPNNFREAPTDVETVRTDFSTVK